MNPLRTALRTMAAPDSAAGMRSAEADFELILDGYQDSGGLASGDDLSRLMRARRQGDLWRVAKLIVAGEIVSLEWDGTFWIPMFQFELHDLSIKPGVQQILAELGMVFDGWAIALWFIRARAGLADRRPVDLLASDLPAVLAAARADRFDAAGSATPGRWVEINDTKIFSQQQPAPG